MRAPPTSGSRAGSRRSASSWASRSRAEATVPAPGMFSLDGRVALVTGASSGIGREIALALAEAGAAVVLVARRAAELEAARHQIEAHAGRAAAISADLSDRAHLRAAAAQADEAFGAPDILVNAAGINIRKPLLEVSEADWDAV